jgi:hypothetical protein
VSKWTSRKFLVTLGAQLTGLVALLWPGQEAAVAEVGRTVMALVLVLLSSYGYVRTEGELDRARCTADSSGASEG